MNTTTRIGHGDARPSYRPPASASATGVCLAVFLMLAALYAGGCGMRRRMHQFAARQTADLIEAGSLGIDGFWDYELAGEAMPSAIMQGEALVNIDPQNPKLLIGLAKAYVSYCFGWIQSEWEIADLEGDFERADAIERRVRTFYRRAADLGLRVVHARDTEGQLAALLERGDLERVHSYLKAHFNAPEDVAPLYYAGLGWGSEMAFSGGDLAVLADAPIARSLLERSVEIDPSFNNASGLALLGTVESNFPQLFGGDLDKARSYFERALKLSARRNHLVQISYAHEYAVAIQDRELYETLLREVIDSPDLGADVRLSNAVAAHRARWYLAQADELF